MKNPYLPMPMKIEDIIIFYSYLDSLQNFRFLVLVNVQLASPLHLQRQIIFYLP